MKGAGTVEWLEGFRPNVQSVSPSWSFAYGLFKKEQVRFVFSYLTSLAYHGALSVIAPSKCLRSPRSSRAGGAGRDPGIMPRVRDRRTFFG
ncbi:MAG: hypothetical protein HC902_13080, partial [Calothrix sp. SM1_5_4]|nr:hypothetical protein [Calothrix sp. SM1_5_4]